MKKFLIFPALLLAATASHGQTTVPDSLQFKDGSAKVGSISNDSTLAANSANKLITQQAVKKFAPYLYGANKFVIPLSLGAKGSIYGVTFNVNTDVYGDSGTAAGVVINNNATFHGTYPNVQVPALQVNGNAAITGTAYPFSIGTQSVFINPDTFKTAHYFTFEDSLRNAVARYWSNTKHFYIGPSPADNGYGFEIGGTARAAALQTGTTGNNLVTQETSGALGVVPFPAIQPKSNKLVNYTFSGPYLPPTPINNIISEAHVSLGDTTLIQVYAGQAFPGEFKNGDGIFIRRSNNGGASWGAATEIFDTTIHVQDVGIDYVSATGTLLVTFHVFDALQLSNGNDTQLGTANFITSTNQGATWSAASTQFVSHYGEPLNPFGKTVHTGNGKENIFLFRPNSVEQDTSSDGTHWGFYNKFDSTNVPAGVTIFEPWVIGNGYNGDSLIMYFRNNASATGAGRSGQAVSTNNGATWTYVGEINANENLDTFYNRCPVNAEFDSISHNIILLTTTRTSLNGNGTFRTDSGYIYTQDFATAFASPTGYQRVYTFQRPVPTGNLIFKGNYGSITWLNAEGRFLYTFLEGTNSTDSVNGADYREWQVCQIDIQKVSTAQPWPPSPKYDKEKPVYNALTGFYDNFIKQDNSRFLDSSTGPPIAGQVRIIAPQNATGSQEVLSVIRSNGNTNLLTVANNGTTKIGGAGSNAAAVTLYNYDATNAEKFFVAFNQYDYIYNNPAAPWQWARLWARGDSTAASGNPVGQFGIDINNGTNGSFVTGLYGKGNQVAIGTTTLAGAYLNLHAGTSSLSPINIASGALTSAAVAGNFGEYDGTYYYETPSDGNRRIIAFLYSAAAAGSSGTVSQSLTNLCQVTCTPTGAVTFNATGGKASQRVSFIFTSSGTTAYTITFGTNFKSQGTLSTGTVSGKVFTVDFAYDGTNWNELGRVSAGM